MQSKIKLQIRVTEGTMEVREEVVVDEARRFRATVAVVDADVGGGRRGEYLTLVFQRRISLNHRNRVVAGRVRLQVPVPQKSIAAAAAEAPLQRPVARLQHLPPLPPPFPPLSKIPVSSQSLSLSLSNKNVSAVVGSW